MDCLTDIVGVTADTDQCLNAGLSDPEIAQLAVSNSGLYLDMLPGGISLGALGKIDTGKNMAQMAAKAIATAIKTVQSDLVVALNSQYTTSQKAFMGTIGQMSYAGLLANQKQYQAFLIRAKDGSDAILQINRIGLIVNAAADINILIYVAPRGAAMGTLLQTIPMTTSANNYVFVNPLNGPLILPLSQGGQPLDYYFIYDGTGLIPKDNKIFCNCPGGNQNTVKGYIQAMGVQLDDPNNLSVAAIDQVHTRGLLIDCQLRCNNEALICGNYSSQEAVAVVLAYAVQFKAGELLIEEVMKTREINRYTMQNKEYLWGKRNAFITQYDSRINYLAQTIDVSASNCFVCRDTALYFTTPVTTDGGLQNRYETMQALNQADYTGYNPNLNTQQVPGVVDLPESY